MPRGRPIHNDGMVARLRAAAELAGAWVRTEASLGVGVGAADLIAGDGRSVALVEAERTPARGLRDLEKARAIGATHLIIATPTARVAEAIRRRLTPARRSGDPVIVVQPLGLAAQALARLFSGCGPLECTETTTRAHGQQGRAKTTEGHP